MDDNSFLARIKSKTDRLKRGPTPTRRQREENVEIVEQGKPFACASCIPNLT